jgi:hypothetical protein
MKVNDLTGAISGIRRLVLKLDEYAEIEPR